MADWFYSKNGQQLGPVSEAVLRQMAASGQLLPADLIWKEGMAQWAPASQLPGLFAAPVAPPMGGARVSPTAGQYGAPPAYPQQYGAQAQFYGQPPVATSGMAIASLVCSLIFCFPPLPLLGIIFGIIGIVKTSDGRLRGKGLAIAGLVVGVFSLSLSLGIILPALNRARQMANRVVSQTHEIEIGRGILMYCNDHRGQYPPNLTTVAKTEAVPLGSFVSPGTTDTPANSPDDLETGGHCSYVYIGQGLVQGVDPHTVVLFEEPASQSEGVNMLFTDGHSEFVSRFDPRYAVTARTP